MTTTTGKDLTVRLDELCADFKARSARKHLNANGGWAEISYTPERFAWSGTPRHGLQLVWCPQVWFITYHHASGAQHAWGSSIGTTKAAAIAWLLRQRRDWP